MRSRLEHYFEFSVFLMLTAGFLTVAGTGALDFVSVTVVSLALLVRGFFLLSGRNVSMPQAWDPYFTFGYVAFYAADYFLLARGFVDATVHLVLFSMMVKIFSVRRDRDYIYLTVLAFMEVLAASVLTVDTVFLGAFTVFSLLAVNTFIAFEVRRSWAASGGGLQSSPEERVDAGSRSRFSRALSGTALVLALGIVLIASGIFFVLPRITAGYFSRFAPKNRIESGFSEDVRLGQIGEIQQSSAVVMHIDISGKAALARDFRLRGVALSLFDGRQWFNPLPRRFATAELAGCFNVLQTEEERKTGYVCTPSRASDTTIVRYRVLMEPMGTNVFFLAPSPLSLAGNYRELTVDAGGAVYNSDATNAIGVYTATSDLSVPSAEKLRNSANFYSATIALRYLQLPRVDPRVKRLAEQVTARETNNYDKAVALEHYLQTNYGYTLQLPKTTPPDPIANFLFERRMGHCEYFASAMAIMLRTIGIPSRIVNGFRGGEYNDVSGRYIVRARDAHSWVEAYFPGSGWVTFDPTPAAPSSMAAGYSRIGLYLDAMREFWREWVVNYDFGHQRTLGDAGVIRTRITFLRIREWARERYDRLLIRGFQLHTRVERGSRKWIYYGIGTALLVLLAVNMKRARRFVRELRLSRNPQAEPVAAASLWYKKMVHMLGRKGVPKTPTQTPDEFAAGIADPVLQASVELFTRHYQRARFADSSEDAQRLPSLYDTVREAVKER